MRNIAKTALTGLMNFTVFRYLATNNGPLSNAQFPFQGNVVKVNHI
jgi:hypothetical protein